MKKAGIFPAFFIGDSEMLFLRIMGCLLALNLLAPIGTRAAVEEKPAERLSDTETSLLALIRLLRHDPLRARRMGALPNIVGIAQNSKMVVMPGKDKVFAEYMELAQSNDPYASQLLFVSFLAGNAEYQLMNGVVEYRPLEGVRFMLQVYQDLLSEGLVGRIERFDQWRVLDRLKRMDEIVDELKDGINF